MLIEKLKPCSFNAKTSAEDVNIIIVMEVIEFDKQSERIITAGEDIDLFPHFIAFAPNSSILHHSSF